MRIWDMWARQLLLIEEGTQDWPEVIRLVLICQIPKTKSRQPLKMRDLGMLSRWYNAWASMRFDDHENWLDSMLPLSCTGVESTQALYKQNFQQVLTLSYPNTWESLC